MPTPRGASQGVEAGSEISQTSRETSSRVAGRICSAHRVRYGSAKHFSSGRLRIECRRTYAASSPSRLDPFHDLEEKLNWALFFNAVPRRTGCNPLQLFKSAKKNPATSFKISARSHCKKCPDSGT
jgi:hypothetical protein